MVWNFLIKYHYISCWFIKKVTLHKTKKTPLDPLLIFIVKSSRGGCGSSRTWTFILSIPIPWPDSSTIAKSPINTFQYLVLILFPVNNLAGETERNILKETTQTGQAKTEIPAPVRHSRDLNLIFYIRMLITASLHCKRKTRTTPKPLFSVLPRCNNEMKRTLNQPLLSLSYFNVGRMRPSC